MEMSWKNTPAFCPDGLSLHILKTPINVTLRRFVHGSDAMSASWNLSLAGGQGGWQSDGCRILGHHDNFTTISCNSLGNYGLLMVGVVTSCECRRQFFRLWSRTVSISLCVCDAGPQQRGVLLSKHPTPPPSHLRHGGGASSLPADHHRQLHLPSQVRKVT